MASDKTAEGPVYTCLDLAVTLDMTAWQCRRCDAVGTGWPPQPIFCDEKECPARRCATHVE